MCWEHFRNILDNILNVIWWIHWGKNDPEPVMYPGCSHWFPGHLAPSKCIIGWLDWAPKITNNLNNHCYTHNLSVIALDENKFKENFKGNFVYLGMY